MRTIVRGKNFEVPEALRRRAERKLARIERILDDRSDALVELSIEHHRSQDVSRIVEVTLVIDGRPLRSTAAAVSHEAAIDVVVDKLERQAVDHREKPRVRARPTEEKHLLSRLADGTADRERPRRIVKTKRFAIEPMFEEDAIGEMEELGHSFFLFVNAENEQLALVYRRSDGDFGLIEPVIGGSFAPGSAGRVAPGRDARTRAG
ncbi:MAG: ribosome-associated translation inhibitor RaiA [Chloroflexota bacterium]|nr:ribosome-associated translation inhibitor RaiA [Chloroflexota bacterium]